MSLDVRLFEERICCKGCGLPTGEFDTLEYEDNITHNLVPMAKAAGIYKHLWHPSDVGIERAKDLIIPLEKGLDLLKNDPVLFRTFNCPNGWGTYDNFVPWVQHFLDACKEYPAAFIYTNG